MTEGAEYSEIAVALLATEMDKADLELRVEALELALTLIATDRIDLTRVAGTNEAYARVQRIASNVLNWGKGRPITR